MSNLRVLISGASVAGPALAYWLIRAGCQVTVVERAPSLRIAQGQGIDVRESARDVVKRMGIFDLLREKSSHEEGIHFVDSHNRPFASFGVDDKSGKGDSLTCDIEILRGDLAEILFDRTKSDAKYIFGETVESLEETDREVRVKFTNGTPTTAFDLVVAADGLWSKIRGLAFGGKPSSHIKSLNTYVSYFSIPPSSTDTMWSRAHWVKGGRLMVFRPDNVGRTRAFLMVTAYSNSDARLPLLAKASKDLGNIPAQKALIQDLFADAGWEISRVLDGMRTSDDFYLQHVGQVKLDRWSSPASGRVTVVGDAGYAPSPFTGMGTSMAFIGAYVLAGEISRRPDDIPAALQSYERVLRPYFENVRKLPPGVPWIANPQSRLGIRVLETVMWTVGLLSKMGVAAWFSKAAAWLPFGREYPFQLPDYEAFR
ncbi:MAG: hypothetical protein Q9160_007551 [Pyrenula sp. 1 TL-2023]